MALDILRGTTSRNFARGEPPPRGSWEYCGVGDMWHPGRKDEIGVRLWTPSAIRSFISQIDTESRALALTVRDEMKKGGSEFLSSGELTAFKDFYTEVRKWIDSKPSAYWGANVDRGVDYQKRMIEWHNLFQSRGGRPVAPGPSIPKEERPPASEGMSTGMKAALILGGGAALLFGAASLAGKFRKNGD